MLAPPLLVSYSSVEDYLHALPEKLRTEYEVEIRDLVDKGLPPVVSSTCLAILFGISTKFVNAMCFQNHKYYREFKIRKGKKTRKIQAPKVAIKVIQKWFGYHLANAMPVSEHVYGFVSGRSAIDAAQIHCQSKWIFSVDIENFFPTTTKDVIKNSLINLGYSEKGADTIVPLCCYREFLAQGAPSSPPISNLVMTSVDKKMISIAAENHISFTRYADDIVFSGADDFPEGIKESIQQVFENTCWKLSANKTYFADNTKGQRLKVHGLLVHGEKVRLTKGYRNKIRAFKYLLEKEKVKDKDVARLTGHVRYADSVDKK